jgi:hypothetical protein
MIRKDVLRDIKTTGELYFPSCLAKLLQNGDLLPPTIGKFRRAHLINALTFGREVN